MEKATPSTVKNMEPKLRVNWEGTLGGPVLIRMGFTTVIMAARILPIHGDSGNMYNGNRQLVIE